MRMKNLNLLCFISILLTFLITGCIKKGFPGSEGTDPILKIRPVYPNLDCPIEEPRPTFLWTEPKFLNKNAKYHLVLVELKDKQSADSAIVKNRKLLDEKNIVSNSLKFPKTIAALRSKKVFAYQISTYNDVLGKEKIIAKSDVGLFYTMDKKLPDYFQNLLCCEQNLLQKSIGHWKTASGTPYVNEKERGCMTSQGTIQMKGNRMSGDAVYQELNNSSKIKKGNYYQLSFCAKPDSKELEYIRFKIIAFNGSFPDTETHPEPSENIAVIGESSDISGNEWNRYFISPWRAPKNYDHVAILIVTNEDAPVSAQAMGSISNVCLQMTDDCGLTANNLGITENGNISNSSDNYIEPGTKPEEIEVDYSLGSLVDMFGQPFNTDGSSNWYNLDDECIAIGGDISPEALELVEKYDNFTLPGEIPIEAFNDGINTFYEKFGKKMDYPKWDRIPEEVENDCRLQLDKSKPFNGRDIIYVHGLVLDHILKRTVANDQTGYLKSVANGINFTSNAVLDSVAKSWPGNQEEFYADGFYHNMALSYYDDHIKHFLGDLENPSNRYILVAYNSSQRLIENVHAALTQISKAMNDGKGVVYNEKDPRGPNCFGKEVVIISHSTGALLMDVAMAIAEMSGEDDKTQDAFGDAQYISKRVKVHVSLHGAIAGSELAQMGVFGANLVAVTATGADVGVDVNIAVDNGIATGVQMINDAITGLNTAGTTNNTDAFEAFMDAATDSIVNLSRNLANTFNNSVLVDLSPTVSKLLWGKFINQSKVPVLTVAGGHPGALSESIFTKWLLPGFDDGVVNTNSQSGSPSLLLTELYLYIPPESRIFQKGIDIRRSSPYFAEQSKGIYGAAYGSIPWLAPSGMVQPVLAYVAPSPRYPNHFPFLQSASEHMHSFSESQSYVSTFGASNLEECLAVENNFIFENELVNPDINDLVERDIRGQDLIISFRIPYPVFDFLPPPPSMTWQNFTFKVTIPIWRRTYDTLSGNDHETTFVYNFVLRE